MKDEKDKKEIENRGVIELYCDTFARCFVMPRELFEKTVMENTHKGIVDIEAVAKKFGVSYLDVVAHGRELGIWH